MRTPRFFSNKIFQSIGGSAVLLLVGLSLLIYLLWSSSCSNTEKEPTDKPSTQTPTPVQTETPSTQAPATPAPASTETAVPVETPPTNVVRVTPVTAPSVADLITDLADPNGSVAKIAALRLIGRSESVESLVETFSSGSEVVRARVVWCLRQMNEPVRIFFAQVRRSPEEWRPSSVEAVNTLTDLLSGEPFAVQPTSQPESAPPTTTPPPVQTPPTQPVHRSGQSAPESSNQLAAKKILLTQLEAELGDYRRSLSKLRADMLQAARNAKLTWVSPGYYFAMSRRVQSRSVQQRYAQECLRLKLDIKEAEEIVSLLSSEIRAIRKEISDM